MVKEIKKALEESHESELVSYLNYKKRKYSYFVIDNNRYTDSNNSDSSISDTEVKRKKKLNYLKGKGQKDWSPKTNLVLNGNNITEKLDIFRRKNILLAEKTNNINPIRILSLSFIFPINIFNEKRCVTTYIKNIQEDMYEYVRGKSIFSKASDGALQYCKNLIDASDVNGVIDHIKFEPLNTIDKIIKELCKAFLKDKYKINKKSESTFIQKHITPFIKAIFSQLDYIEYSTIDSVDRKERKKPDLMLGIKDRKRCLNFFFIEAKRPNVKSSYQAEDDFVKLMKHLKNSINYQVSLKVLSPMSLGILCEGFTCSLIKMTLTEDGIYLPTTLRQFCLIDEYHNLVNIPRAVESFMFIFNEMLSLKTRYDNRSRSLLGPETNFVKPSFETVFY
ncbi:uncharacterized protein BX663DRAFT_480421 [Cokeromyces recurvatus]|uniref:uncharacterized protein n=1 Tax=Cokeromyces recurvatus TaxID=90255 RepID=UPI00221F5B22|nr:uncharacterized protein BX663DRAFT_480421 [Cokeromyces recurvatus]KAI7898205.1 hypothetical protein BX663DRAFT_480421 [Cokeromyces recurvatus]